MQKSFIAVIALYSTSVVKLRRLEAVRLLFVHVWGYLQNNERLHRSLTNICYALVVPSIQVQELCGPRLPSSFIQIGI